MRGTGYNDTLLLGQATSALDSVNEKEVQKALDDMLLAHQGVRHFLCLRAFCLLLCGSVV